MTTLKVWEKHFGNVASVSLSNQSFESFMNELSEEILEEDKENEQSQMCACGGHLCGECDKNNWNDELAVTEKHFCDECSAGIECHFKRR